MDTQEARMRMLDLATEALQIVEGVVSSAGKSPGAPQKLRLRELVAEARTALPDAGFPAEAAWRGVQRASIGTDTFLDQSDPVYWQDVAMDLRSAVATLQALISPGFRRDADVHIIG